MEVGRRWHGAFSSTHSRIRLHVSSSHSPSFDLPTTSPPCPPNPSTHNIYSTSLLLYSALPGRCASLPFQHILWSPSVPAALWQPSPLVPVEGGADGDVFEDTMSPEEVHSKRQVICSHPFQFCCT